MIAAEFSIGDRVLRARDLYDDRALQMVRRGTIVDVYLSATMQVMYAVKWDDARVAERGYLAVGLTPEQA